MAVEVGDYVAVTHPSFKGVEGEVTEERPGGNHRGTRLEGGFIIEGRRVPQGRMFVRRSIVRITTRPQTGGGR